MQYNYETGGSKTNGMNKNVDIQENQILVSGLLVPSKNPQFIPIGKYFLCNVHSERKLV